MTRLNGSVLANLLIASALVTAAVSTTGCGGRPARDALSRAPGSTAIPVTIDSISPQNGPQYGGTRLQIRGTNVGLASRIDVGGAECYQLRATASDQVTCLTSRGAIGVREVSVELPGGSKTSRGSGFTYQCQGVAPTGLVLWANDGGDKVAQEEQRASCDGAGVRNSVWDGAKIRLFGAKNEVVGFNVVLEASKRALGTVTVSMGALTGPGGATITSTPATGDGVFDWTQRNIELFFVRYLKIEGLSRISYETYDERHVPQRLRRSYTGNGIGQGSWTDRPDHDFHYPDIAVPLEIEGAFDVASGRSQSVWADIYVPKSATPGLYTGTITVTEQGSGSRQVPVELTVRGFSLPDTSSSKTMLYLGYRDLSQRYLGVDSPEEDPAGGAQLDLIRNRHFQLAHRHRIALVDDNPGNTVWTQNNPRNIWWERLSGALFTAQNGYAGPGESVGNGIYSVGNYGNWKWKDGTEQDMWTATNAWEGWFQSYFPSTERFLYLIDESYDYAQTERWASWVKSNPGIGKNLPTYATLHLPDARSHVPSLDIASSLMAVGDTSVWDSTLASWRAAGKRIHMYNGRRPGSGSFALEDDGVALRELPWGQYKKDVDRWFYWESTYYNDFQGGRGQTNVFQNAHTFGGPAAFDSSVGMTGYLHSNGDGVLFYPGTDQVYPSESYGLNGPIASLRLKHWRRGIQDVDYLTLARAVNPARVDAIVRQVVPKVLWETGVENPADPSYKWMDVSWSTRPDDWEEVRKELADLIEAGT